MPDCLHRQSSSRTKKTNSLLRGRRELYLYESAQHFSVLLYVCIFNTQHPELMSYQHSMPNPDPHLYTRSSLLLMSPRCRLLWTQHYVCNAWSSNFPTMLSGRMQTLLNMRITIKVSQGVNSGKEVAILLQEPITWDCPVIPPPVTLTLRSNFPSVSVTSIGLRTSSLLRMAPK